MRLRYRMFIERYSVTAYTSNVGQDPYGPDISLRHLYHLRWHYENTRRKNEQT